MEKMFYLTREGEDEILYESSNPKMIKQAAMDLLVEDGKKVLIHNRWTGKVTAVPDTSGGKKVSHRPVVTFNGAGNPCYLWAADNPERNDCAEYDLRTRILSICGRTVGEHPAFRGLKPFRDFVVGYLADCRDGYDPHKVLGAMTDITQMAAYINRNRKTWRNEVFPYMEKYGWRNGVAGAEIIGRQGDKLLSVSVKGMATVLTDNNRMDIAGKLLDRIRQSGLPMTAVAERSGVPISNIYKILKGTYNPSLDLLERLAGALGFRIDLVEID